MDSVPLDEGISSLLLAVEQTANWSANLGQVSVWSWLSILACLFLSALFSASETALTALTYAKVHQLITNDSERFGRLKLWMEKPNRVLTTILVGNNIANILASSLATHISERVFGSRGIAIAVGLLTLVVLITGEIIPKTFAKHHSERVARQMFPILLVAYWVFFPLTWCLTRVAVWVVRIFGGSLKQSGPFMTEEDIEYMIGLSKKEGVLDEDKEKLLQSILEFDDITIREVMVPRTGMLVLSTDSSAEEVLLLSQEANHSRIPVYQDQLDHIVGILYLRDLFRAQMKYPDNSVVDDWKSLLRAPYFVPGTMKISVLLKEFQRRKNHLAVVVDEFGGTMGLVSLEDILEEIVGEIRDEFDPEEPQDIIHIAENVFHADAYMSIRELGELLGLEFPDDGDYETLGGFVTALFGRVPKEQESIDWNQHSFCILKADEKHVLRLEIKIDPDCDSMEVLPSALGLSEAEHSEEELTVS